GVMPELDELQATRKNLLEQARAISEKAKKERRELTNEEQANYQKYFDEAQGLKTKSTMSCASTTVVLISSRPGTAFIVTALRSGLVPAPPAAPVQHQLGGRQLMPDQLP